MVQLMSLHLPWKEYVTRLVRHIGKENDRGFCDWIISKEYAGQCVDPWTWYRLYVIHTTIRKDSDHFILICSARPRLGKSILAMHLGAILCAQYSLKHISYNYLEFLESINESTKFEFVHIDEGALILHAMERGEQGMSIDRLSEIMGQKNLVVGICLNDLLLLRRHFRDRRIDTLIYVTERGNFIVYTGVAVKIIVGKYKDYHGNIAAIPVPDGTSWSGWYRHYYHEMNDISEQSYRKHKEDNAKEFLRIEILAEKVRRARQGGGRRGP